MSLKTKAINRSKWLISYPIYWYNRLRFHAPEIKSIEETIEKIIETNASVSRYGDGELDIMVGRNIPFQKYHPILAQKMKDILLTEDERFLVCLNDVLISYDNLAPAPRKYWRNNLRVNLKHYVHLLKSDKVYYNTCITRPYMRYADKSNSKKEFDLLKKIWRGRDIVFVEGNKSRLGVGNDLFDSAKSIRRILCPAKNAFDYYEEIIKSIKKHCSSKDLLLIALGPTATAMSYDLYRLGYQAIDMGHVDIEYEWFKMGATEKVPVKNKYTNEAIGGTDVEALLSDEHYEREIIDRIGR